MDFPSGCQPGPAKEVESRELDAYYKHSVSEVGIMQPRMFDSCLEASRHPPPPQTLSGLFHIYCYLTNQILRTYTALGIIIRYLPSPQSTFSTNVCPNVPVYLKDLYPSCAWEGQIQPSQLENPALAKGKASSRNILIHHLSRRPEPCPRALGLPASQQLLADRIPALPPSDP